MAAGIERFFVRDAVAGKLIRKNAFTLSWQRKYAAACQRLQGFGPDTLAIATEMHMPIVNLLAHGNVEVDSKGFDEVLVFVAIEHDRVDHADLPASGVEIEAYGERQPFAGAGFSLVDAVDFYYGTNRACLFDGD